MINITDVNHLKQNWESEVEMNLKLQDASMTQQRICKLPVLCDEKNHYKQDESEMMLMFWCVVIELVTRLSCERSCGFSWPDMIQNMSQP